MKDVTVILAAIDQGDPRAASQLLPLVYNELRKLASQRLLHESPGQTLQATALVHEVWLRLIGDGGREQNWNGRGHFFGAAAEAMRRILIENARRKRGPQQGGHLRRVDLDAPSLLGASADVPDADDLDSLDAALSRLSTVAPRKAELVKLRYFAGLTIAEAAALLKISAATAERDWEYARVWLYSELSSEHPSSTT